MSQNAYQPGQNGPGSPEQHGQQPGASGPWGGGQHVARDTSQNQMGGSSSSSQHGAQHDGSGTYGFPGPSQAGQGSGQGFHSAGGSSGFGGSSGIGGAARTSTPASAGITAALRGKGMAAPRIRWATPGAAPLSKATRATRAMTCSIPITTSGGWSSFARSTRITASGVRTASAVFRTNSTNGAKGGSSLGVTPRADWDRRPVPMPARAAAPCRGGRRLRPPAAARVRANSRASGRDSVAVAHSLILDPGMGRHGKFGRGASRPGGLVPPGVPPLGGLRCACVAAPQPAA